MRIIRSAILGLAVVVTLSAALPAVAAPGHRDPIVETALTKTPFACTLLSAADVSRIMGEPWVIARELSESIKTLEKQDGPQPSFGSTVPVAASGCVWKVKGTAFASNELFNLSVLQYSAPLTSRDVTKIGNQLIHVVGGKVYRARTGKVGQWAYDWPVGVVQAGTGVYVVTTESGVKGNIPHWEFSMDVQLTQLALDRLSILSHV